MTYSNRILCSFLLTATVSMAGPVFLTGHDPDFHAQDSAGAQNLLNVGLDFVTGGTYNDGASKFLWIESNIAPPGGHRVGKAGLTSIGLTEGTHFDAVNAAGLSAIDFSAYSAIAVASSFGGLLTRAELDALVARSTDVRNFVNAGGGLLALAECLPCGANLLSGGSAPALFGFVPVSVLSIANSPPYTVTPFGASLGLTSADVNDPSHNAFMPVTGLNIVDLDAAGNPMTLAGQVRIDDGGFIPGDPTIPEPSSALLLGGALAALAFLKRR